jgi:hypothetical protein
MIRKESEGHGMRLYFEDAEGRRLAIDTAGERYCSNFQNGSGKLPDGKRYIWVDSGKDLEIILQELEFSGWSYDDSWIDDRPGIETDLFARVRKADPESALPFF